MLDSVIDVAEDFAVLIDRMFKRSLVSYCTLETGESENVLVCQDGTMVSALRIDGTLASLGRQEHGDLVTALSRALQSHVAEMGHTFQFWFERDPEGIGRTLEAATHASLVTAKAMGLDVQSLVESSNENLGRYCSAETMILGIWTSPSILSTADGKRARAAQAQAMRGAPVMQGGQNLLAPLPDIRELHESKVANLLNDFKGMGIKATQLDAHAMGRLVRASADPEWTPDHWEPCLPGDPVPIVERHELRQQARELRGELRQPDLADIQYPPLPHQLFPRDGQRIGNALYRVGTRVYAPLYIEIFPRELMAFASLFDRMAGSTRGNANLPWRMSFLLDGGGMGYTGFKSGMASMMSFFGQNRLIDQAMTALKATVRNGESVVRVRVALMTWGKDEGEARVRAQKLAKALGSWGKAEVREVSGDPAAGFMACCALATQQSPARAAFAPITDIVHLLPYRPTSAWEQGVMTFRTMDGKLMPFQPGSSLQTTWNYLFFARPGQGKSVTMAKLLEASCLKPGMARLPRIGIIDIGPSSKGFVQLMHDILPEHQKHYAQHYRMRMTREYTVNPFDTQLGMRRPTAEEKSFLVDFLLQLVTPPEVGHPHESMGSLVAKVIDEMYAYFCDDDRGKPKLYNVGLNPRIDETLSVIGFAPSARPCWFEVVDALFDAGYYHEAKLAQRYAVPDLSDAAAISRQPAIKDLYGKVIISTNEPLNEAFGRLVSDAVRDFPVFSGPTVFDIGDSRIVALDIEEVAKDGSPAAKHQASVMYMTAHYILSKDTRLTVDMVPDFPARYRSYHKDRIAESQEDMKWLVLDEFHRTNSSPMVRNRVIVDMREGRKWNLGIMLASQSLEDFDETMREFATAVFIFNPGTPKNADKLCQIFAFSDSAKDLMLRHCNGPRNDGAPMFVQFSTTEGTVSQLLVLTNSAIENWALSTTPEDVQIRNRVFAAVGPGRGRILLGRRFPSGRAKAEVERLREKLGEDPESEGAIDRLAAEVLALDATTPA